MSVVSLLGVQVISNPANFLDKYQLEITFECLESLSKGNLNPNTLRENPTCNTRSTLHSIINDPHTPVPVLTTLLLDLEWKLTYVGSATRYVSYPVMITRC